MKSFFELSTIDVSNKCVVITGANTGLGFEVAKYFAKHKAHVILCSRDVIKGEKAKDDILFEFPLATIQVMQLDLSRLDSVDDFASNLSKQNISIDILVNNAGIMAIPYAVTEDGFEKQLGVNHLGHFYLTSKVFDLLNRNARIVNVSSMAYAYGKIDKENMMFEKGSYTPFKSYARSKLANLLFTFELASRLKHDDRNIIALAAHPGVANTDLFAKKNQNTIFSWILRLFSNAVATPFEGAKPIIAACVDKQARKRDFYGPYKQRKHKGDAILLEKVNPIASSKENQAFLWDYSLKQTNTTYPI